MTFEETVPAGRHDEIMEMIALAVQGQDVEGIYILAAQRHDAINARAHGIIEIDGEEYVFIARDGNLDGTVIESWDQDRVFETIEPTRWALQPTRSLIDEALANGRGSFLLLKWDTMLEREGISEIPSKYTYDRYVQPGMFVERYWREAAAKHHFDIVSEEEAAKTRKRLEDSRET